MGSDKALLPFRDSRLGQSVAGLVERAAGGVVLVGNPQLAPLFGYPAIPDLYPGEGPLGGILTALGHTASDWNLLVACDMPGLSAEFLAGLMDAAARSGADALVPVGSRRPPGTLVRGLPSPLARPLGRAFARGVRKIVAALEEENAGIAVCRWPVAEAGVFQNVNTPEDWASGRPAMPQSDPFPHYIEFRHVYKTFDQPGFSRFQLSRRSRARRWPSSAAAAWANR